MGCLRAKTTRTGPRIKANCSLVCSVGRPFIKVAPKMIFLTRDNNFSDCVSVEANVVWRAE